ncbi:MAG: transposase, partial [Bacteroidia bacterium]|nr:transposase [Bacteroidia bacterium]
LDNVKYHRAKKVQRWLERHKDRIEFLFLPLCSPDLNPIRGLGGTCIKKLPINVIFKIYMKEKHCFENILSFPLT